MSPVKFLCVLICSFSRFCAIGMEIGMLLHKVIWGIRIFLKPFRLFLHAFLYFEDSCWFVLVLKLWVVSDEYQIARQTYTLSRYSQFKKMKITEQMEREKQRKRDKQIRIFFFLIFWIIFFFGLLIKIEIVKKIFFF